MGIIAVLYLIVPFLCLATIRKREPIENMLTKDATLAIRGVGMLLIVYTHMAKENISAATYFFYVSGVAGVAACFLVSGYGLHISFCKKANYLNGFWLSKILRLVLPFFIVFAFSALLNIVQGDMPSWEELLDCLLTVRFPGTTLWYLKIQFLMYAIFWFAYRIFKQVKTKIIAVFTVAVMYVLIAAGTGLEQFWYNSCLFFPLGLVLAEYQDCIIPCLRRKESFVVAGFVFAALFSVLYIFGRLNLDWLIDNAYMLSFCIALLWIALHYTKLHVLELLGKYSIEIYLIHTVIGVFFDAHNPGSYLLLPAVSLLLGIPLHCLTEKATGLFRSWSYKRNDI